MKRNTPTQNGDLCCCVLLSLSPGNYRFRVGIHCAFQAGCPAGNLAPTTATALTRVNEGVYVAARRQLDVLIDRKDDQQGPEKQRNEKREGDGAE